MNVQIICEQDSPVDPVVLERLAQVVLAREGYGGNCLVDVTLVSDCRIAELNRCHRRQNRATDVLALPLQVIKPGVGEPVGSSRGPPLHLGDVVIAPDYVRRQAARAGWDFSEEMGLMVVHGILHLLGYLHDSDSEAVAMEERERRHLAERGLKRR